MPRKIKKTNIEKDVMTKITKGQIRMKPKSYFILGSIFMGIGIISAIAIAIIFLSIDIFSLRLHGPFYQRHITHMLEIFPWWAFIIALGGIISGYYLLKRYDFSYKKNAKAILIFAIICVGIAAYLVDYFGLNNLLLKQTPFRGFYQNQFEKVCKHNPDCMNNPRIRKDFPKYKIRKAPIRIFKHKNAPQGINVIQESLR